MSSPRRRRSQTLKKSFSRAPVKKRKIKTKKKRQPVDLANLFFSAMIILVSSAILVLIVFALHQQVKPRAEKVLITAAPDPSEMIIHPLQMEVLNGCGTAGIAAQFTDFLRENGFDVVKTDNYTEMGQIKFNIEKTVLIDRRGDKNRIRPIADALGLPAHRILSQPNEAWLLDATLILGMDYSVLSSWQNMEH